MKFQKKVVVVCLIASFVYVVAEIIYEAVTGKEVSPTLTECFLGGVIGELAVNGLIKVGDILVDFIRIKKMSDSQYDVFNDTEIYEGRTFTSRDQYEDIDDDSPAQGE